jgi:hypothetical protein
VAPKNAKSASETRIKPASKVPVDGDRAIAWAIAVNRARIVAPWRVIDRELSDFLKRA